MLYIIEHEQLFYTFAKGAESVNPESISGIQNQEIKEIFKNSALWQEISISGNPKINLILPDYFKKISFYDKKINNSQFTPVCFLIYE